jgi:hypothetical protein
VWQHCCRPWSLTCEPCSFGNGRTGLVWVRLFEMAAPIQSPAKWEVHSLIRFLNAKCERPADVHRQIVAVYGDVMNRQNVCTFAGDQWLSKLHSTPEPRQPQHEGPVACVVTQLYSDATFVSLPCHSCLEKLWAYLKMLIFHFIFTLLHFVTLKCTNLGTRIL